MPSTIFVLLASWVWLGAQQASQPSAAVATSAETLLAAAIKQAQAEKKNIFIEFGAAWNPASVKLRQFLENPQVRSVLSRHYVMVSVTSRDERHRNVEGAENLLAKLGGRDLPFFAILDSSGVRLPEATGSGFPSDSAGADAFIAAISRAAPRLRSEERDVLSARLSAPDSDGLEVVATRRLWSSYDVDFGPRIALSPDGRLLAYNDTYHWGTLLVRDLAAGDDRLAVGNMASEGAWRGAALAGAAFSRDNQFVAFMWRNNSTGLMELRTATIEDRVPAEPRALVAGEDITWIRPYDWSPDGKSIAVQLWRKNSAEVALVSLANGAVKVLKTYRPDQLRDARGDAHRGKGVVFSPDGSRIALEFFPVAESPQRDITVISADGTNELPAVSHPADDGLIGWLPDGQRLLFTSDRMGRRELWTTRMRNGEYQPPDLVPHGPDLGDITPLGVTTAGAFAYISMPEPFSDILTATIDFDTGRWRQSPRELIPDAGSRDPEYIGGRNSGPRWSPDGRRLAYVSRRGVDSVLVVRTSADASVREFPAPRPLVEYSWSPDGAALAVTTLEAGKATITRLDPSSGRTALLVEGAGNIRLLRWATGDRVFFDRPVPVATGAARETAVIERDLVSGAEREVFRGQSGGGARLAISPDGGTLYYRRPVPVATPPHDLVARDLATGAERVLVSGEELGVINLSNDGRHVMTTTKGAAGSTVLFLVPTSPGSVPVRLQLDHDDAAGTLSWFTLAPDARSALAIRSFGAWVAEEPPASELWWIPTDDRPAKRLEVVDEHTWLSNPSAHPDGRIAFTRRLNVPSSVWLMEFNKPMGVRR